MSGYLTSNHAAVTGDHWLRRYYAVRAAFSVVWVLAALTAGMSSPLIATALLLVYPMWDALANLVDAQRNGGLRSNPTQSLNAGASTVTAVAVGIALAHDMHAVLGVFGVWAVLSGLLQLATAVRRRRIARGQWLMIISGVQSAAAGAAFLTEAASSAVPSVADIAPYAAFGAFYFAISAVWLFARAVRHKRHESRLMHQ